MFSKAPSLEPGSCLSFLPSNSKVALAAAVLQSCGGISLFRTLSPSVRSLSLKADSLPDV